jgi:hypothetical protein
MGLVLGANSTTPSKEPDPNTTDDVPHLSAAGLGDWEGDATRACGVVSQVQQRYNDTTEDVADLTSELGSVSEKLEYTKNTMDEQENNRLDTKPLHDIKRAKEKLRTELKAMEVRPARDCLEERRAARTGHGLSKTELVDSRRRAPRRQVKIGVAEHTMLQTQLKAKNAPQPSSRRYDSDDD